MPRKGFRSTWQRDQGGIAGSGDRGAIADLRETIDALCMTYPAKSVWGEYLMGLRGVQNQSFEFPNVVILLR
jgi:hypothetical protein